MSGTYPRTAVINVVGLTRRHLGPHTPKLTEWIRKQGSAEVTPAFPAVTCTAQSDYLTGRRASEHGIVANGWYHRELAEVQFWKQSNHVVTAPKIWEILRSQIPGFTCAQLFWWYNMYSQVEYSLTPRPMYPADGRKFFDIYSWPYEIRPKIKKALGEFPFPTFWGPAAGIKTPQGESDAVSRWIANSAQWIENQYQPTLSFVYLPHLDYNLQRLGPNHSGIPEDLRRIDDIAGELISFFEERNVQPVVLSEYGITPVNHAIHLNRIFREKGWLTIKDELGRELIDFGQSAVFAVADHQVAHIYLNRRDLQQKVVECLMQTPGVADVIYGDARIEAGLSHSRAGDLIAVSEENAWFTYYYWMDDNRAPDFARCVDIHRKPGYDPVELFLDPTICCVKAKILGRLLQKKLGFRMLMDVIPLDASLVKGSHGARPKDSLDWPIYASPIAPKNRVLSSTDVFHELLRTCGVLNE